MCGLPCGSVKNLPAMWETQVWSTGWKDPLKKGMATHSSILAWRIPWTEEPGGLQSMVSQRVGHDWQTDISFHFIYVYIINILFSLIRLAATEIMRDFFFFFLMLVVLCLTSNSYRRRVQGCFIFIIKWISTLVSKPMEFMENILGETDHCPQQTELFN